MASLKCLVCNNRIDNNYNNDSGQLFKTVCSLLDLDNFILNSPLTISNAFCDDCQVIALKLFNLQTSLIQIQLAIKTTIATITKTILQTQTQIQQEQEQKGKKTVVKIPCEEDSGQFLDVEIKQENEDEEEEETEKNDTIKLISNLRKIVYTRFSPVIKVRPCPVDININFNFKPAENSEITIENITTADLIDTENVPQRRSKRRAVKKTKFEEYVSANEEEEEEEIYNDVVNYDDDYSNDDDFDYDPSMGPSIPFKKPRLSSSETNSTNKEKDPDPDYELPDSFNVDDYAYTKVIFEKSAGDAPPQSKEVTRWKCPNCQSSLGRGRDLKRHFAKYHGPDAEIKKTKKPMSEPIPEKPGFFLYAEKWEYEMKEDPETGPTFTCSTCGLEWKTKTSLTRHLDLIHNLTPKCVCLKCKKSFVNESYLKSHPCVPKERKKHHRAKELPDGSFIYDDEHRFVKIDDEADVDGTGFQFQCCVCKSKRKLYVTMMSHMRLKHSKDSKGSLCNECGKVFITARSLRTHIDTLHSTEIKYTCEICGRPCRTQGALYGHKQRVHSEATFKCATEGCDKIYTAKATLMKHCSRNGHALPPLPSWTDPQIVHCSRCDSKFKNMRALKVHEAACTGIKKKQPTTRIFSCRECKKTFFSLELCKKHEFSHTQERQVSLSSTSTATTTTTNTEAETIEPEATVTSQSTTEGMKTATDEQDFVMESDKNNDNNSVSVPLPLDNQNQQLFPSDLFLPQDNFTLI